MSSMSSIEEQDDRLVTVRILGMPLEVQRRAQQHADELIRELTLVAESMRQHHGPGELPQRLVQVVDELTGRYSRFTVEQEQQLADALEAGADTIDLEYCLPASVSGAVQALGDILDEADDYCRDGQHLLTLATPPDLVDYRRWYLEEFSRQTAGAAPMPWADHQPGS